MIAARLGRTHSSRPTARPAFTLPGRVISKGNGGTIHLEKPKRCPRKPDHLCHLGELAALADEMVTWDPVRSTFSPGRIDSMVFAIIELMLGESNTGMLDWIAQGTARKREREAEAWLKSRNWLDHEGRITPMGRQALVTDLGHS